MRNKYTKYLRTYKFRSTEFQLAVTGYGREPKRFYRVVRQHINLKAIAFALRSEEISETKIAEIMLKIIEAEEAKDENKSDVFERIIKQMDMMLLSLAEIETENKPKQKWTLDFDLGDE